MKQRLLHIVPTLEYSGFGTQLRQLAPRLAAHGFDVRVLNLGGPGPLAVEFESAGIPVESLGPNPRHLVPSLVGLPHRIRAFHPHIVHTWTGAANLYGRLVAMACRIPLLVASYRTQPKPAPWLQRPVERILDRRTDTVVLNSQTMASCTTALHLPASRTRVVYSGVEPQPRMPAHERNLWLSQLGLPPDARLIVTVGPLTADKRIKDLIWATDLLKAIHGHTYLLVIGDGPLRWRLERYRDQVRIRDRVRFLGPHPDAARWIAGCDCLWQASRWESAPMSVLEAMAAGTPVIASDIPGHREVITPEQTGILVPVGDRAGYARQADRLLTSPQLAAQLAQAARNFITADRRLDAMLDAYLSIYQPLRQVVRARRRNDAQRMHA